MSSSGEEPAANGGAGAARAGTRARHSPLSHEQIVQVQHARILEATVQLIAERGLRQVTAQSVVGRAGVSRRTLYSLFGSMEDCAVAALALVRRRATLLVSEAFEREAGWPEGVLAGLGALLDFLDSEPQSARVCLVETFAAGPAGLSLRARELQGLAPLLDAGRAQAPPGHPHALRAEATIASVAGILQIRLVTGEAPPFIDLLAPLAGVVLSPYLDAPSLQRELERAQRLARTIAAERPSHPPPAPPQTDVDIPRRVCLAVCVTVL